MTYQNQNSFLIEQLNKINVQIKILKPSEWVEKKRILKPSETALEGKFKYKHTPYLKEIIDNLSICSDYQTVVLMKGAQIGATVGIIENYLGYLIDYAPAPVLYISATDDIIKDRFENNVDNMIESCGLIKKLIHEDKTRNSKNAKSASRSTKKMFKNGFLQGSGWGSLSKLRSLSAKNILLDEVDAPPAHLDRREGNIISLAKKRANTFSKSKKIFITSTPKDKSSSRILKEFLVGDCKKFLIPCIHCEKKQELKFKNLIYETTENGDLNYKIAVKYACNFCGGLMSNSDKDKFLPLGHWEATKKSDKKGVTSYHLNALYSPSWSFSWEEIVEEWLETKKDKTKLKAFVNTVLGEVWEDKEYNLISTDKLLNLQLNYKIGEFPTEVEFFSFGCDVQKTGIFAELLGWDLNGNSYLIDFKFFKGSTENFEAGAFANLLAYHEDFKKKNNDLPIFLTIDRGFQKSQVDSFFLANIKIVKGLPTRSDSGGKMADFSELSKDKNNIKYIKANSNLLKELFFDSYSTENGYKHFLPRNVRKNYLNQLRSEEKREVVDKFGAKKIEWYKTKVDNHALDCHIYNIAFVYELIKSSCGRKLDFKSFVENLKKS